MVMVLVVVVVLVVLVVLSSLKETCVKQKPYPIMRNSITKILVM